MTTHAKSLSKRFTATLAVILFIPPLILFIAYSALGIKYGYMSRNDKIDSLMQPFPEWMQNYTAMVVASIILCIAVIALASRSYKKKLLSMKVIMLLLILASIFLILFYISQLM